MSYKRIVLGTVLFSSLFLFIPGCKVEASETNNIEKTAAINTGEVSGGQTASEKTTANDAEKEKQVASLDLSTLKDGNNNTSEVQTYKTKVVTLDNGEQGLQIGETEPDEDAGALEENMWLNVNGRGMVNLSFKTEPNCKYRLTFDAQRVQNSKAKAPSAQYGLFAAEASAENREVPGSVVEDIASPSSWDSYFLGEHGQQETESKDDYEWKSYTAELSTGSRTGELNAFVYTKDSGEVVVKNLKIYQIPIEDKEKDEVVSTVDPVVKAKDEFPVTIPSIQSFEKSEGTGFTLNKEKETIYSDDLCLEKAEYLASKLKEEGLVKEVDIQPIDSDTKDSQGIFLKTGTTGLASADPEKPVYDSYTISINSGKIEIVGDASSGVQYGAMTLLQALKQRFDLPNGLVKDYSDQHFRGLQVDSGRHYWSVDWIKNEIENMAYMKQNALELRLKDNQGFRYDSKVLPDYVDRKGGFFTDAQIKDLLAYAKKFDVTIIPEVDFPGHSDTLALSDPSKALPDSASLDISKQSVRDFMTSVYDEVADLFETKIIHIGGDEYFQGNYPEDDTTLEQWAQSETKNPEATKYDAFKLCMNEVAKHLKDKYGCQVWMWNDNIRDVAGIVPLDKDIVIDVWSAQFYGSASIEKLLNGGFKIVSSSSLLYHDTWPDKIMKPAPDYLWDTFDRTKYDGGKVEPSDSLGQFFPIWDDAHGWASEHIVTQTLFPRFAAFAQQLWGAPKDEACTDYSKFETLAYYLGSANDFVDETAMLTYNRLDAEKLINTAKEKAETAETETQIEAFQKELDSIKEPAGQAYTDLVHRIMFFNENGFVKADGNQEAANVESLKLGATGIQVVKAGKTLNLVPIASPENTSVSYTFSKDGIVTVDDKGVLTAVKPGMVKVTAKAGDKTAVVTVRVTQ